ncbi:MAG: LysR family transcriptional regulator [Negativicutes bacterium]|nr:LysR family transcriptional regulator [Negativicutes bacterium]
MYSLGIEAFLAIVRAKSISRAAEELYTAQSTISHRLKKLEQIIGASLVDRGKGVKVIRLTPTGEEFVRLAERWDALMRETQILQAQGPRLTLSVGAVDSLNTCFFPPLYRLISRHQPQMMLEIRTQHSVELYDEVDKGLVDVAFVLRERSQPNVHVEKCFAKPMVVLRLATSETTDARLLHPSELDPNHELFIFWGLLYQEWHDKWWDPLCPSRIRLDSFHLISSLLQDPKQWAIVPSWVANRALEQGNFAIHRLADPPPDAVCYKLTHKYPKVGTIQSLDYFNHYFDLLRQNALEWDDSPPTPTPPLSDSL